MKKISLCLNIILVLFFLWYFFIHVGIGAYYGKYVSKREPYSDSSYYKEKVKGYRELNEKLRPQVDYDIFIGDSFIEQFPVAEMFPGKNILNRGIALDSTVGLLKRLEHNANNVSRISRCFMLIGYNDLSYRSSDAIAQNIVFILSKVKAEKKYFISILPCHDAKSNARIRFINQTVKSQSGRVGFEYIDVYQLFGGDSGKSTERYFYDGVHLNIPGYLRLQEALEQYMN